MNCATGDEKKIMFDIDPLHLSIQDEARYPRHPAVIKWVNDLILDLKLIELGEEPHAPITMERLSEWHQNRDLCPALEADTYVIPSKESYTMRKTQKPKETTGECSYCWKKIDGDSVETASGRYHRRCWVALQREAQRRRGHK